MGNNYMHEHFRRNKLEREQEQKQMFPIPEYDPQTGERNPYYEELTGKKHPEDINKDNKED